MFLNRKTEVRMRFGQRKASCRRDITNASYHWTESGMALVFLEVSPGRRNLFHHLAVAETRGGRTGAGYF